jgi:hypothetical protein
MNVGSWKKGIRSDFTAQIIETTDHLLRESEKYIVQKDQALLLAEVSKYQHIQKITTEIGWKKLWRPRHTHCQELDVHYVLNTEESDLEHFITEHMKSKGTSNTLLDSLITMNPQYFLSSLHSFTHCITYYFT